MRKDEHGSPIIRTKTMNHGTLASDPGGLSLSYRKLNRLDPSFCPALGVMRMIRARLNPKFARVLMHCVEHMLHGDSRAAVVIQTSPRLLVAAYTDELDCVVALEFPVGYVQEYGLSQGSRLLTINTYGRSKKAMPDLQSGPDASDRYTNFAPYIAEFLSEDRAQIDAHKGRISEAEWERARQLGDEYLVLFPGTARDGRPRNCGRGGIRQ